MHSGSGPGRVIAGGSRGRPHDWLVALLAAVFMLLASGACRADELVPVPPLTARVTDLTGTLSREQAASLESDLAQFEASRGSQIAVLLIPTTRPEPIEVYGIRVAEAWKIGRKGIDDGIILLVAKNDRTLRIEVGRGLEGALPDAVAKRIVAEVIGPRFKEGDFYGGLRAGVAQIQAVIAGEPLPPPVARAARPGGTSGFLEKVLPVAMLFIFVGGGLLRALFGRLPGASLAGAVAFLGGWLLLGSLAIALLVAVVVFFLTLAGGSGFGGLPGGGGRGGFGRGGFGGGGFSGGGGGFGGGGASGRW